MSPQSALKVSIAGTSGSVEVNTKPGATALDVLVEAALGLGLDAALVERLSAVVDSKPIALDDVVPADARELTAATRNNNG